MRGEDATEGKVWLEHEHEATHPTLGVIMIIQQHQDKRTPELRTFRADRVGGGWVGGELSPPFVPRVSLHHRSLHPSAFRGALS